jgi:WD40 repeat protein
LAPFLADYLKESSSHMQFDHLAHCCLHPFPVEDRVPLKVLEGHVKGVTAVSWSPLYKFVASGGQDRRIMLWNPFSLKPLATLQVGRAGICLSMQVCWHGLLWKSGNPSNFFVCRRPQVSSP